MAEILFDKLDVYGIYIAIGETLALYAEGRTSGMVLTSGHGVTCSVPIYDGYCLKHAIQRLDITGEDCTEYLLKLLAGNGYCLKRNDAQEIKETLCYVAFDYDAELKKLDECKVEYPLPDGNVITIDSERFKTPEIMFNPQQIGLEENGVHNLVYDGVMQCDIDLRKDLMKNIVICGGNLMYDGIGKRLKKEVSKLAENTLNCKVNVIESSHRKYSQLIGGSVLTAMPSFEEKWITKEDYEEYGAQILYQDIE